MKGKNSSFIEGANIKCPPDSALESLHAKQVLVEKRIRNTHPWDY